MATTRHKLATALGAVLFAGLVTAPSSRAEAVWNYEDANGNQCNPDAGSDIINFEAPKALLMLDRSGSMGFVVDENRQAGSGEDSRWDIAEASINALTADVSANDPDPIKIGLGTWTASGYRSGGQAYFTDLYIDIDPEAMENSHDPIQTKLAGTGPQASTPTAQAIDASRNSATIQGATGAAVGVLITDGKPAIYATESPDPDLFNAAVESACEHRAVAPLYVVGFGTGTDESFNNVVAAAGGTGTCPSGDPCASGTGHQYDAFYWMGDNCDGSFQANDPQALLNALTDITNAATCTYDVSTFINGSTPPWDDPGQGCAGDDYECLDINLGGTKRIHHISNTSATHVGWKFADAAHTTIKILDSSEGADADYCTQIQNGVIDNPNGNDVSIKLACMCVQPVGDSCSDADFCYNDPAGSNCGNRPGTCECPVGTWSCTQGLDYCEQDVPCGQTLVDDGATDCDAGIGACMETGPVVCTGGPNGDGQGGTLECSVDGDPSAATEETCNGIDDDCDGEIDELGDDTGRCHVDYGDDADEIAKETNRCKIGYAFCGTGGATGCQALEPMPEICNGIDDDCDGEIDNLSDSWADFTDTNGNAMYSLPAEAEGAACYERDVCQCMDGHDAIEGAGFDAYVDSWTNDSDPANPTCTCGEGLARE